LYTHPSFFPSGLPSSVAGAASGNAAIIYSARRVPGLPGAR
jgi:hypothetical protein